MGLSFTQNHLRYNENKHIQTKHHLNRRKQNHTLQKNQQKNMLYRLKLWSKWTKKLQHQRHTLILHESEITFSLLTTKQKCDLSVWFLRNSCMKCYVAFLKRLPTVLNRNVNGKYALLVDIKDIKECLGDEKSKSANITLQCFLEI